MNDDNIEVQNYDIKPIENGFQVRISLGYMSKDKIWSFRNWAELVEWLDTNPPKFYERLRSEGFVELEYDPDTFNVSEDKAAA